MPRKKLTATQEQNPTPEVVETQETPTETKTAKPAKKPAAKYWTKEGYDVKSEELDYVHVKTSKFTLSRNYDKTKNCQTHIVDPQMWKLCRTQWAGQGMEFEEMLHYPIGTPTGFPKEETEK